MAELKPCPHCGSRTENKQIREALQMVYDGYCSCKADSDFDWTIWFAKATQALSPTDIEKEPGNEEIPDNICRP